MKRLHLCITVFCIIRVKNVFFFWWLKTNKVENLSLNLLLSFIWSFLLVDWLLWGYLGIKGIHCWAELDKGVQANTGMLLSLSRSKRIEEHENCRENEENLHSENRLLDGSLRVLAGPHPVIKKSLWTSWQLPRRGSRNMRGHKCCDGNDGGRRERMLHFTVW